MQSKELSALAQRVRFEAAEPIKFGLAKDPPNGPKCSIMLAGSP